MLKWILLLTLGLLAVPSFALPPLTPYQATYKTTYKLGFNIDVEAERALSQNSNGEWVLDFRAQNWFARIQQTSTFLLDPDTEFKPLLYRRYQRVFGKTKEQQVIFHWDQHRVTNDIDNKPWKMDIPPGTQDLLSYQLKLRYNLLENPKQKQFQYPVADGGKIKYFTFRVVGEEILQTPMGKLNTIKLESLRHSKMDVEHLVWLAKDWDNLLLRIEPVRRKDKEEPVILVKAMLAGEKVKGF
ncbi:DUF3108 domain-containing protein [Oceanospirillum sp.]|uniref:DUF3108 domain-containing protein n=1 Tax=Oceanospirillum sp. TaxID=2021254 RepID=UPI003A8D5F09